MSVTGGLKSKIWDVEGWGTPAANYSAFSHFQANDAEKVVKQDTFKNVNDEFGLRWFHPENRASAHLSFSRRGLEFRIDNDL